MMANAQKMIEERKKALSMKSTPPAAGAGAKPMKMLGGAPSRLPSLGMMGDDKNSRLAQLQVSLKFGFVILL